MSEKVGEVWRYKENAFQDDVLRVCVDLACIDSTLVRAHDPDVDLRLEKNLKRKTQRVVCLW